MEIISKFDILFSLLLFFFLQTRGKTKLDNENSKLYSRGLTLKLIGAIAFCLIYALYYKGGDSINYYKGVKAMNALLLHDFGNYIEVLFTESEDHWWYFYETGVLPPHYMFSDPRTFTVIKISSIISILGLGGYMSTTLILSYISFKWVWKLFTFLLERYPGSKRDLSISLLYLPSIVFWGSGILKDTYTFGATCLLIYNLNSLIVKKDFSFKTIIWISISLYLIIIIKSYILFALLPGLLIFLNFERLRKIKSPFSKYILFPLVVTGILLLLNILFFENSDFSTDEIFQEAAIQQSDLTRDVYGENSFDIGYFEPTLQGGLSKFPAAVNAALFRPYLWEVGSPTMLLSGIENTLFLGIAIYALLVTGPFKIIRILRTDPFMLFCLTFTLILGFGVGLSTANFGALVRYKIPFLPFFVFILLSMVTRSYSFNSESKSN